MQAREATYSMEREMSTTGEEMTVLGGAISELKEVYIVGKENVHMAENAAAVASAALKLKPIVEKASTLRESGDVTTPIKSRLGKNTHANGFGTEDQCIVSNAGLKRVRRYGADGARISPMREISRISHHR